MKYKLTIFADFFQIYLEDEDARIDVSMSWTSEAVENLLALDPKTNNGFVLSTVRNMVVPLEIEFLEEKPVDDDFSCWDQVNECSIGLPSGVLVVSGCTEYRPKAARIPVEPGTYRARLYYGKLDALRENDLEGDDHYRVALWLADLQEPIMLKKRNVPND